MMEAEKSGPKTRQETRPGWRTLAGLMLLVFAPLLAATILLYLMAAYRWPVMPSEKITQPAVTYSKMPPGSEFSISLEAPIDHPYARDLDVTLVVTNWSEKKTLRLLPFDTGWPLQTGDCPSLKIALKQLKAPVVVGPHSGQVYLVHLVADCPSEAQPISLHYRAVMGDPSGNVGDGSNEVDGYILTAPLTLVGETRYTLARFFILFNALIHLFLAPLTLLAIGVVLNEAAKKREETRQREQDTREKKFQREQEARDRRSDVLNTLITNYRDLVFGDYLPIVRRMQAVEVEMPAALKALAAEPLGTLLKDEEIRGVFCAILLFRARLLSFVTQKGGIYFRSKQAELLAADLFGGFIGKVWEKLGKEAFEQAAQLLPPDDTLAAAKQKCASGIVAPALTRKQLEQLAGILAPEDTAGIAQLVTDLEDKGKEISKRHEELFAGLRAKLLEWANTSPKEFRGYTRLLQIATALLEFECDRPFYQTGPMDEAELQTSGWYFDPPVLDLRAMMYEIPKSVGEKREDNPKTGERGQRGILPQLHDYWMGVPENCRGSSPEPPNNLQTQKATP